MLGLVAIVLCLPTSALGDRACADGGSCPPTGATQLLQRASTRDKSVVEEEKWDLDEDEDEDEDEDMELSGLAARQDHFFIGDLAIDAEHAGKKCGDEGDVGRVFEIMFADATMEACMSKCEEEVSCAAVSGEFGKWCAGCTSPLFSGHDGAVAFTKSLVPCRKDRDCPLRSTCDEREGNCKITVFHEAPCQDDGDCRGLQKCGADGLCACPIHFHTDAGLYKLYGKNQCTFSPDETTGMEQLIWDHTLQDAWKQCYVCGLELPEEVAVDSAEAELLKRCKASMPKEINLAELDYECLHLALCTSPFVLLRWKKAKCSPTIYENSQHYWDDLGDGTDHYWDGLGDGTEAALLQLRRSRADGEQASDVDSTHMRKAETCGLRFR